MARFNNLQIRARGRIAAVVPAGSGNYASERITFGSTASGVNEEGFFGITALLESGTPASVTVELWVRRATADDKGAAAMADSDFTNSGLSTLTAAGVVSWTLAGGIGAAQIRVKSGGNPGTSNVSAWAS